MAAEGLYAYAVTESLDPASQDSLTQSVGIGGGPLSVVAYDDIVAVVSPVDLEEFGEAGLKRNLEDLDWVREVAFAHDDVVRAVSAVGPVAPLRLATIFLGPESVQARLAEWHEQVREVLARIRGRGEFSVKVFTEPAPAPARPDRAAGGSGRDYLTRRREAAQAKEHASTEDQQRVQELHQELLAHSVASRILPAQDRSLSGHRGEMLMNAAYLVDDADAESFRARVTGGPESPRLRVSVEGPWPPYSFAELGSL